MPFFVLRLIVKEPWFLMKISSSFNLSSSTAITQPVIVTEGEVSSLMSRR